MNERRGLRLFALLAQSFHEDAPVELLRQELVMRAAEETAPVGVVHVGPRVSIDVVELQEASRGTPVPAFVDEGAASFVPLVDLSLRGVGSVMRV